MVEILQGRLPPEMLEDRALPGIQPLDPADWLRVDDAYAGQMARREALLAERPGEVLWLDDAARPAAEELLEEVLARLPALGFDVGAQVTRPDGARVAVDRADPMRTLGLLVQNDFCLMEKRGGEHVLTGAVLCFPASWMLGEKAGRPLTAIHDPVDVYDADLARRVQRLFDGVQAGRPLWRFNRLAYVDPELHQPRSVHAPRRAKPEDGTARYRRAERQCILRLPRTGAAVFSIHTYVVAG